MSLSPKTKSFLAAHTDDTTLLVVDVDVLEDNFKTIQYNLPKTDIFYAVKANPAKPVLRRLVKLGACFDAASIFEIEDCLATGAKASMISFGNTIKKSTHIKRAFDLGIDLFAFDSAGELEKLAEHAPGAKVYCRILTENAGADWPLSRKFGCELDMAIELMVKAHSLGLVAHGLSFHVGSQQTDPHQWDVAIGRTKTVFTAIKKRGIDLKMINLGGGYPVQYKSDVPAFETYANVIQNSLACHFGDDMPHVMIEPGRYIAASAGVIQAEVVLISEKRLDADRRWVFLDVGMFGGLAETMDEAIKYIIHSEKDGNPTGPVAIAGPTCDGMDILYEKTAYELPLDLAVGDRVWIADTGAYTATYSSVNFNGFEPLKVYCI